MATEIEIANRALGLVGISKVLPGLSIALLDGEDDTEAQVILWFATCRDVLLQAAPWTFGISSSALTLQETADGTQTWANEWLYSYRYPSTAARVWKIMSRAGRRANKIPMQVRRDDTGAVSVMTDEPEARALIMSNAVTLASNWDATFGMALSHYLASMLAMPLRSDKELARQQTVLANEFVARAREAAGIEVEPTTDNLPSMFLDARRGS